MFIKSFLYISICMMLFSNKAHAYLDPGSGGILIQALIGFLIGVGIFFKNIKFKILNFFQKKKQKRLKNK